MEFLTTEDEKRILNLLSKKDTFDLELMKKHYSWAMQLALEEWGPGKSVEDMPIWGWLALAHNLKLAKGFN